MLQLLIFSVVEFKGDASLNWVSNLEAETNGFENKTNANIKINLFNGGDAATSGDGMWGELKIVTDKDGFYEVKNADGAEATFAATMDKVPMFAKVDTAKIHFVDGDVGIALNILKPDLNLGKIVLTTATSSNYESQEFNVGNLGDDTAGFALEVTSAVIDANFKVIENGVTKDMKWGFGADATLKVVDGMNLAFAFANANDKTAFKATADYKLAIDEKLYVKPAVGFGMIEDDKALAVGALFGWGTEGQEPDFFFVGNKCADGFSVVYKSDLKDDNSIAFGLYDSTLVAGLKTGVSYSATLDDFGKGSLSADVKYGTDIDILSIALAFGYTTDLAADTNNFKYSAEVSTDDVIDNTNLYAKYEGGKDNNGKITVGAKIAL